MARTIGRRPWPFHALALACAVVSQSSVLDAQTAASGNQHSTGRLFPPQDLGLLEAPDRDEWQRSHEVLDALGIADASVVADVGAGSGWFTVRLARRVGPNGVVYAQDVQSEMLQAITRRVSREGLQNVRPIKGSGSNPNLPATTFDAVLIVDVVHEIDDRVTMFRHLGNALKPAGRIGVVDFRPGGAGPGPDAGERVAPSVVEADAARAGLRLIRTESFLPFQYFLIFGRSDTSASPATPRPGRAPAAARARPGR